MIQRKLAVIAESPQLQQCIGRLTFVNNDIVMGDTYSAISCDVTDLAAFHCKLEEAGVDFNAPTLLVSECVLTYIDPER